MEDARLKSQARNPGRFLLRLVCACAGGQREAIEWRWTLLAGQAKLVVKDVWAGPLAPKVKAHLWLIAHIALPTVDTKEEWLASKGRPAPEAALVALGVVTQLATGPQWNFRLPEQLKSKILQVAPPNARTTS